MVQITAVLPVRLGIIEAEELSVTEGDGAFRQLEECARRYFEACRGERNAAPGDVEGIQNARSLFRSLGIDPTKTRPSSEALLRRALKQKPFHRVNTLVDVCNWCSLDFLLPIGLYDRDKIAGNVMLRKGEDGEGYEGIGKPPVNVAGRYVLADEMGPFGSPTSDSLRTCITTSTKSALMVIFAPSQYPDERLDGHCRNASLRIVEYCGGKVIRKEIVHG